MLYYFYFHKKEECYTNYNLTDELQQLDTNIRKLQKELRGLPPGKLLIAKNGNRCKWYLSNKKSPIYLPKSQRNLAESLARKKYLSLKLSELRKLRASYSTFNQFNISNKSDELLLNPFYHELLTPFFNINTETINEWMNIPYISNPYHPEGLTCKTSYGQFVRSKSEGYIASSLYKRSIPFKYECPLTLGDMTIYPDFTILHPKSLKIYYWEHFGMMDNPDYSKKTFSKLNLFNSYDIIPSINLITTYETKEKSLNFDYVENLINYYFS